MIRSMTGYGMAENIYDNKKITVEIRTLNSKQLDLILKLPNELRFAELDFRNKIGTRLLRGKVDATITIADTSLESGNRINANVVESYWKQIGELSSSLGFPLSNDPSAFLFRFPGVFEMPEQQYGEAFVATIAETIDRALDIVDNFRVQEGQTLKKDLLHRINLILDLLGQVEPLEKGRHESIKQRLTKNLSELLAKDQLDENRFEAELIYYLEKLDITEEKVRLRQHCNYFVESSDEDQAGKKLGFISQEMGREINTLGSKANEATIQRLVVMMKDELEKIKEQVLNIL